MSPPQAEGEPPTRPPPWPGGCSHLCARPSSWCTLTLEPARSAGVAVRHHRHPPSDRGLLPGRGAPPSLSVAENVSVREVTCVLTFVGGALGCWNQGLEARGGACRVVARKYAALGAAAFSVPRRTLLPLRCPRPGDLHTLRPRTGPDLNSQVRGAGRGLSSLTRMPPGCEAQPAGKEAAMPASSGRTLGTYEPWGWRLWTLGADSSNTQRAPAA